MLLPDEVAVLADGCRPDPVVAGELLGSPLGESQGLFDIGRHKRANVGLAPVVQRMAVELPVVADLDVEQVDDRWDDVDRLGAVVADLAGGLSWRLDDKAGTVDLRRFASVTILRSTSGV